jgi:hypothetical protein
MVPIEAIGAAERMTGKAFGAMNGAKLRCLLLDNEGRVRRQILLSPVELMLWNNENIADYSSDAQGSASGFVERPEAHSSMFHQPSTSATVYTPY